MKKHTQEPWPHFIEWCEPATPHPDSDGFVGLGFEDYRRARACVNACRGLPTDELEQKGLVAAVGTKLLEVEQQRDELLAALNDLTECYFETTGGELSTPRLAHHLAVYRDAINLVTKHKGCAS